MIQQVVLVEDVRYRFAELNRQSSSDRHRTSLGSLGGVPGEIDDQCCYSMKTAGVWLVDRSRD